MGEGLHAPSSGQPDSASNRHREPFSHDVVSADQSYEDYLIASHKAAAAQGLARALEEAGAIRHADDISQQAHAAEKQQ